MAAFATDLNQKDLNQHFGLEGYSSNALKLFMEHLDQQSQSRLLDVGPVCEENIRFFANRVWKHYVCDMFIRLDRYIRKGDPVYQIWKELDYHPESFDGILVWELADRLDEQDVNRLVTLCHSMLKPGGMAVVMVITEVMDITMVGIEIIGIMEVMDTKDKQTIITTQVEETITMVLTDTIELRTALANV